MKYKLIKQFPGSWMMTGEINTAENIQTLSPESYPEFFQLVEYNFEGRIIKVGDKVGDASICAIDYKGQTVFLDDGDFMWMDKLPIYYSVVDWKIVETINEPLCETQFTSCYKKDAEDFILNHFPCFNLCDIKDILAMSKFEREAYVQKKLNERPS